MSGLDFLFTVDKFLGAMDLKVGALVIALIELLVPFLLIAYYNTGCLWDRSDDEDESIFSPKYVCYIAMFLHVFFITSAILIVITYSDDSLKIPLYAAIWIQMILLIIYLCIILLMFFMELIEEECFNALTIVTIRLILLGIMTYFIVVLNSWYKEL